VSGERILCALKKPSDGVFNSLEGTLVKVALVLFLDHVPNP